MPHKSTMELMERPQNGSSSSVQSLATVTIYGHQDHGLTGCLQGIWVLIPWRQVPGSSMDRSLPSERQRKVGSRVPLGHCPDSMITIKTQFMNDHGMHLAFWPMSHV